MLTIRLQQGIVEGQYVPHNSWLEQEIGGLPDLRLQQGIVEGQYVPHNSWLEQEIGGLPDKKSS